MLSDSLALESDRAIDGLSGTTRSEASHRWQARIQSELEVARSFEDLVPRLRDVGAEPIVIALASSAAAQELAHAELCQRIAERYGERSVPWPDLSNWEPVRFGYRDEPTEVLFHIAGLSCVNETIAAAWLQACVRCATSPSAREVNRAHLRDEIDHARLGWAHLASSAVTTAMKTELSRRLRELIDANVAEWERDQNYLPGDALPDHGLPSRTESTRTIRDAVESIILPGFAHVGVQPRPTRRDDHTG